MGRRFVNVVIDEIGMGPYQLVVLFFAGGVYAAEGAVLLIAGMVASGVMFDWNLTPLQGGAMAFSLFVGLTVGTFVGATIADQFGRLLPILWTYGGIVVFLLMTMITSGYAEIILTKFLLGLFMGFGMPAANVMICECVTVDQRSNIYSMSMIMFALGQMYSAGIIWSVAPTLQGEDVRWRLLTGLGIIPSLLLFIGAYFYLQESPHWLAAEHRMAEVEEVLIYIADVNGKEVDFLAAHRLVEQDDARTRTIGTPRSMSGLEDISSSKWTYYRDLLTTTLSNCVWRVLCLFGPYYRRTTTTVAVVCFISNMSYYGMIYGLPRTLETVSAKLPRQAADGWTAAGGVFVATLFEVPGVFLAILLGSTLSRRSNLTLIFSLSSAFLIGIACTRWTEVGGAGFWLVSGVKMFIASGFIIVYLYMLECYPTVFRATGLAFNMIVGRIGAICSPFLYEGLMYATNSFAYFFLVLGLCAGTAAILCHFLPYETKGKSLVEE